MSMELTQDRKNLSLFLLVNNSNLKTESANERK